MEVARRQVRQTARQRRRDFGGRRTRISQKVISSGRQLQGGGAPALDAFAIVAGRDSILASRNERGVAMIWVNNVIGLKSQVF
jgi:hypothetical protein